MERGGKVWYERESRYAVGTWLMKSMKLKGRHGKDGPGILREAGKVPGIAALSQLSEDLWSGHSSGTGKDVFPEGPLGPGDPLIKSEKVILDPHVAGKTDGSGVRIIRATVDNVARITCGKSVERGEWAGVMRSPGS
ncbi:MAG: hypothetical protein SWK76_16860 [Actinomycetota bacterium]|nr:hypothetical protein [Actinomycetota bacterium]